MTANKIYYPAFIGGEILGVQMDIQNTTGSDISAASVNGVYYCFDGRDYQLLSLKDITLPAGLTTLTTDDKPLPLIPTTDVKIMVDTAGLDGCIVSVKITWGVA